jgi:hypothetical protein
MSCFGVKPPSPHHCVKSLYPGLSCHYCQCDTHMHTISSIYGRTTYADIYTPANLDDRHTNPYYARTHTAPPTHTPAPPHPPIHTILCWSDGPGLLEVRAETPHKKAAQVQDCSSMQGRTRKPIPPQHSRAACRTSILAQVAPALSPLDTTWIFLLSSTRRCCATACHIPHRLLGRQFIPNSNPLKHQQ